ncbi:MAG: hypothetical protein AB8D78_07485 [Akkermansiaceae bacterium]
MKCPRCVQQIHRAAASCPHCGFSIGHADELFGDSEVKLRRLTDAAGIFRRNDRDLLEELMDEIQSRFPQIFISIYTESLGETGKLRQFGFWLLNRGLFEDVDVERPNEAGILIVIDPDSKSAGMSFGYLLDPFFDERDSFECLSRAHAHWLEGRYADGTVRCLKQLEKLLKKKSRKARRDPERFERKVVKPVAVEDLVKKIRGRRASGNEVRAEISEEVEK